MQIKFGDMHPIKVHNTGGGIRSTIVEPRQEGLVRNAFEEYDNEVRFANIQARANVQRVKVDPEVVGVAKGHLLQDTPVIAIQNTSGATMHAMSKRCDHEPREPNEAVIVDGWTQLMSKFEPMETIAWTTELYREYTSGMKSGKVAGMDEALGYPEYSYDGEEKHVFAKSEVLLKEAGSQPRVVYQGTAMYNALTGPIVSELQKRMLAVFSTSNPLNTGNSVVFAVGMKSDDIGALIHGKPGKFIENDMKNNDGSQHEAWRKYEAMFYKKLGAPDWFVREFAKCTEVDVWTRYGVKAHVTGQRWSGETTTAPGNSFVSMCIVLAALSRAGVKESINIHGGDDYLGKIVAKDTGAAEKAISDVASEVGMTAEITRNATDVHPTFYRKRFLPDGVTRRPVPQFGRVLAKINLRANRNPAIADTAYMSGKYLSQAYEHRHVPIIRDILLRTSEALSPEPYVDPGDAKALPVKTHSAIRKLFDDQPAIPVEMFADSLATVYGNHVTPDALAIVYDQFAQSALDYVEDWVDIRDGIEFNNPLNHLYVPEVRHGVVEQSLAEVDTA